jgi:hypothetical protein
MRPAEVIAVVLTVFLGAFIVFPLFTSHGCGGHDSRRAATLSHLKQLALANLMYATSNDEHLSPAETWMDATVPYNKSEEILHDPTIEDGKDEEYGFAFFKPLSRVDTRTVLQHDEVPLVFQSTLMGRNACSDLSTLPRIPRHKGLNCLAFLDGHVKGMPPTWPETPVTVVIAQQADPPSQR